MEDGSPWIAILLTIVLVLINGMLASAEIAMMGLNEVKLRSKADKGDKKAGMLLKMKQNPSNFLSTIQIGITLASLLSGAFAADTLAKPIVAWAVGIGVQGFALTAVSAGSTLLITLLMTYFMLVFGELVPKRMAMANPEKTANRVVGLISGLAKVTKPLVRLLSASTNGVLKLMGIDPNQDDNAVTEEEILLMMQEGREQGAIEESEVEFVSNLFEFTELSVEDAMTHRTEIESVPVDGSLTDVIALMSETGHNKFPVTEGNVDKIVGVIYSGDLIALYPARDRGESLPFIRDIMRPAYFVPEAKMLVELFQEMKQGGDRMAVVVDEYGGTSGIITMMDIIEELVGDMEVTPLEGITPLENGAFLMDGVLELADVADMLKLTVDPEDFDTLSGFLIHRLGYIPGQNQHPEIRVDGYQFQVERMEGALIRSVRITPCAACEPAELPS